MRCVKWNSASRSSWMVTAGTPGAGAGGQGLEATGGQPRSPGASPPGLTVLRLPPGRPALRRKAGDDILDAVAVRVVSGGEGAPGVAQEALLLILGRVRVRVRAFARARPTLGQHPSLNRPPSHT